jgi:hypothetical protein
VQQRPAHGKAAKIPATNKEPAPESPPSASPEQKLLEALDAAIRQRVNGASRPNLNDLLAKEADLQKRLAANGDPAQISREATEVLMSLYVPAQQAPPPVADDKGPPSGDWRTDLRPLLFLAIIVALMSPLICVAGFWWAGKLSENALRKGLRDAGLL